jgi:capsular polysaccharide biosynthesis protein
LLNFLVRWSWLFVLGVIAAAIPAVLITRDSDSVYKSTATLLVVVDPEASERLTNSYAELVKTRPVLDAARQRLSSTEPYEDFADRITVASEFNSQLIRITARHPNAGSAAQIANTTADAALVNLDTLVGRPGTVRIAETAQPANEPTQTPIATRVALAGGLGLLVALSIAIGVESLRSARTDQEPGPGPQRDVSPRHTG